MALNLESSSVRLNCKLVDPLLPANANLYAVTEVPVTETGLTFTEAVKAGVARLIDVDDWVEAWHTKPELTTKSLRDYLGFSQELYSSWVRTGPDALMALME